MYKNKYLKIITYLAVFAILVSTYLTYLHYTPTESSFCNYSETINCDIVNKSIYSEIFNIPIAALGIITFLIIILLSESIQKDKTLNIIKKIKPRYQYILLILLLTWSILFALYLIYIEFFVLYAICLFCVILDFLILEMFILSIKAHGGDKFANKSTKKTNK